MHPASKGCLCVALLGVGLVAGLVVVTGAMLAGTGWFYTPFVYAAGTVLLFLLPCSFFLRGHAHKLKWCWRIFLGGMLLAWLAYQGWSLYDRSVSRLYDRDLDLAPYAPFMPGARAAALDEPASMSLEDRLPRLDGATALYPLYAAFARAVYPQGDYPPETSAVGFHNTIGAYRRIVSGQADMIFVAGPAAEQKADAEQAGVELIFTPVGKEAFVFFVNAANPVDGLTQEQLRGIYEGKVTRWSQVGGGHRGITAFQRNEGSGSQSAFLRFMGDRRPMKPPADERLDFMGEIVRRSADYANYRNALGFSFRYFVQDMMRDGGVKLLAIDGVKPTPETIRDGNYPLTSEFYAVTRADSANPNVPRLLEWILGPQGQSLVEKTGYCPIVPF